MKTIITVNLEVSQELSHASFDLDDLGVTQQEWDAASEQTKRELLQNAVDGLERPCWHIADFI